MSAAVAFDFLDSHYDSSTGRFISEDPIDFKGGDTNLYNYLFNNLVNYTDPPETGPITGDICLFLDIGYNTGSGLVDSYNHSTYAELYSSTGLNFQ